MTAKKEIDKGMDMRIIALSSDAPAKEALVLWGADSRGIPGVQVAVYLGYSLREYWISIPEIEDCRLWIANATAFDIEKIAWRLSDELLDLRLAVEMAKSNPDTDPDGLTLSDQLDEIRISFAASEYTAQNAGADCSEDERRRIEHDFRSGYERAMSDYGISADR